jgi:hypothetical protein
MSRRPTLYFDAFRREGNPLPPRNSRPTALSGPFEIPGNVDDDDAPVPAQQQNHLQ